MPSTSTEVVTDSFDPVFRGGEYFDITHFSRDPCGFAITAEGARHSLPNDQAVLRAIENGVPYLSKRQLEERNADRTHPENHVDPIENATRPHGLSLTPEEKDNLKTAMHGEPKDNGVGGELGFKGIVALREARSAWRKAIVNGAKEAEITDLKAKFEATRDTYRNRGKKVGLRNIRTDENDPNKLKAEAVTISYPAYTVLARRGAPESTQEYSHATGVAAALVTSDGRLVIQHRAVKQIDPLTSRLRPGNDSYCDIPGASVAGLADAAQSNNPKRLPGTPDTFTTSSAHAALLKEAGEELGLDPENLEIKIAGVADDHIKPHRELLILAKTSLTSAEVRDISRQSKRNKNLEDIDHAEKYLSIPATPEAIETLLTQVHCPLPPTHAAALVAAGFMMIIERGTDPDVAQVEAEAWAAQLQRGVADNYEQMDGLVERFYEDHPEALRYIPERMLKNPLTRNKLGYDPAFTPEEQGLPSIEAELTRVGLLPETRQQLGRAALYDMDGPLTDPFEKRVLDPKIYDVFLDKLSKNEFLLLNTGRSTADAERMFIDGLIARAQATHTDLSVFNRFAAVCEMGGRWITYDENGQAQYGENSQLIVPEKLAEQVRSLLLEEAYAGIVKFDETKRTMVSLEMVDDGNQETLAHFDAVKEGLVERIQGIVDDYQLSTSDGGAERKRFIVKASTIAIDIYNETAGKALGAQRCKDIIEARGYKVDGAFVEMYGDSPGDIDMAKFFKGLGIYVEYIHVGKEISDLREQIPTATTHQYPGGYSQATLTHTEASGASHIRGSVVVEAPES
jgi:hypothetical protein